MRALDERMDELDKREEVVWKQTSKQDWLSHGDKNSKFFHTKAKKREARNNIDHIYDAAGNIFEEEEQITKVFVQHFAKLSIANNYTDPELVIEKTDLKVSDSMVQMLSAPYTGEEVVEALSQMHPIN